MNPDQILIQAAADFLTVSALIGLDVSVTAVPLYVQKTLMGFCLPIGEGNIMMTPKLRAEFMAGVAREAVRLLEPVLNKPESEAN
jgi:hypothetical protein